MCLKDNSWNKYSFPTYLVPSAILDAGDLAMIKTGTSPSCRRLSDGEKQVTGVKKQTETFLGSDECSEEKPIRACDRVTQGGSGVMEAGCQGRFLEEAASELNRE